MMFAAVYGIAIGLLMLGQWAFFLLTGQAPEIKTEPIRLAFHLAAEFGTALGLIVAGAGLLRRAAWADAAYLACAGMLLYSVIVSPGYFAQRGQWGFVAMFAVLLALALGSLLAVGRSRRAPVQ
jgi:hypothetical protein